MRNFRIFLICLIFGHIIVVNGDCPEKCFCQTNTIVCSVLYLQEVPKISSTDTTFLDLRYNSIKVLNEDAFAALEDLNTLLLSNNELTRLNKDDFKNQGKLRILQLQKNRIQTIERGAFENLFNLEQLFLHGNDFKTISIDSFPATTALSNLRLDYNPLKCDCELFWFVQWLLDGNPNYSAQVSGTCRSPSTLNKKTLYELDGNTAELSICHAPRFVVEPEDVEIEEELKPAFLRCSVRGYKIPKISWKHDGKDLNLRDKKYKQKPNELEIRSVSRKETGLYECTATNEAGNITSRAAKLKIKNYKSNFLLGTPTKDNPIAEEKGSVSPQSTIALKGDFVQITCQEKGHSNSSIVWYKNGVLLHNISSKMSILPNNSLLLYNLQTEDTGKYDCKTTDLLAIGSSELTVNAAPVITESFPESRTIEAGTSIQLQCLAKGLPTPKISWFKNENSVVPTSKVAVKNEGNTLSIENAVEADSGIYTCLAQNIIGSVESNTEILVKNKGGKPARILKKPFDMNVTQYSTIEIPCKTQGVPLPSIVWLKDNKVLKITSPKFKVNTAKSISIYNANVKDSGIYTCNVTNIHGNDSASGNITVLDYLLAKTDEIIQAANEAKNEVERAINTTLQYVFNPEESKSQAFWLRALRFPDDYARNILTSAEIYLRTLSNVRKKALSALKLNNTEDFISEDLGRLFTPALLEFVANFTNCVQHLPEANCSDTKFHSKYSSLDGTCNNLQNPMWGSSYSALRRLLKPIYENGFDTPVGWTKGKKYYGYPKPLARLVSTSIVRTENITEDERISFMLMQWGQFMDHDLDHSLPPATTVSWEGVDCNKTCDFIDPCFPMEVPHHDSRIKERKCMDFIRTSAVCGTGTKSLFFDVQPREQLNQHTSYIDASQIYGFTVDRAKLLRENGSDLGLLRTSTYQDEDKTIIYLPKAQGKEVDCQRDLGASNVGCFLGGDVRVNEQLGLLAMHTIWMREHNRVATELRKVNPHWKGDTLYYEARRIVIAELQHITFDLWLPLFMGDEGMRILGPYKGYDPKVQVAISNVFATAALRIGHTLIKPELARLDSNFGTIPQGNLSLGKTFFAPWRLVEEGGVDPLMRGFFATPAKKKKPTQNLNSQLIDNLFTVSHAVSLDLAALNIQRSRDHGLPGYLEYRRFCNLSAPNTFDGLKSDISNPDVRKKLKDLYGHPGNVDVWVGGILEDQIGGARFGPLFRCLLLEVFQRLRDGDRFWYENPTVFTPPQLEDLKRVTLSRVLCDNGDNITQITKNIFIIPQLQSPNYVPCSDIPKIDFTKWKNCGAGCQQSKKSEKIQTT